MVVKSFKVIDYSTGTAYRYSDKSGSWQSIEAVDGKVMVGPQNGKGNAGKLATSSVPASALETDRPVTSKVGLLIPSMSGAASSEPTSATGVNKGTDSSESNQSADPSGESSSGSSSTTGSSADTERFEGSGNNLVALQGCILTMAAFAVGWLL